MSVLNLLEKMIKDEDEYVMQRLGAIGKLRYQKIDCERQIEVLQAELKDHEEMHKELELMRRKKEDKDLKHAQKEALKNLDEFKKG